MIDAAKLQARVDEVATLLAPLFAATGDSINPISGVFAADGSGHDKVLDALLINIRPEGASSNIQITVKTLPAREDSEPLQLSFSSGDAVPAPLTAAIDAASLVGGGTALQIRALMRRLTDCYALPLAQRVATAASGAVGDAGDVVAAECRRVFVDNDPATYTDNGLAVGSAGAFTGLFLDSSTGVQFDQGNFEYLRPNGDMFITFRTTTPSGSVANQTLTVRSQDGSIKAVGNQYRYSGVPRAYVSDREFVFQPQDSYLATGYPVSIANRIDPETGLPMFRQALVTTPAGNVLTYRPTVGRSLMGIVRANGSVAGTSVEFFAAAYQDTATAGNPSETDGRSLIFSSPQRTDAELQAIPDQGVWSVEWIHVDPELANVVQSYRTISRAPTMAELRQMKFAQMAPDFKSRLLADTDAVAAGSFVFGEPSSSTPNVFDFSASGGTSSGTDGWIVPEGALAPTTVSVFGGFLGASFNDSVGVVSTARQAVVKCSAQSAADAHCDGGTGVLQYSENAAITVLELFTNSLRQVGTAKQVALYKLAP